MKCLTVPRWIGVWLDRHGLSPSVVERNGQHYVRIVTHREFLIPMLSDQNCIDISPLRSGPTVVDALQKRTLGDIGTIWDLRQFQFVRKPIIVGDVSTAALQASMPATVDLPVKAPNGRVILPNEYASLVSFVSVVCGYEQIINPRYEDYWAYLTVDNRPVAAGTTQRVGGNHVDGFQGTRINPKVQVGHSYVAYDCLPTEFFLQSFPLDEKLDDSIHDFFLEFDRLTDERTKWTASPGSIVFFSAYQVHRSAIAPVDGSRTFVRVSFSPRQFDRLGNGLNPFLMTGWKYEARDIHKTLVSFSGSDAKKLDFSSSRC